MINDDRGCAQSGYPPPGLQLVSVPDLDANIVGADH